MGNGISDRLRRRLYGIPSVRSVYRRVRFAFGLAAKNPQEMLDRLLRIPPPVRDSGPFFFDFPWGRFEYVHLGNLHTQYREIFVERQYAFGVATDRPVIIDCGGNVGLSALWFKQNYPGCTLDVYEPDPEIAALLRRNLVRAGYPDVRVLQQAVWTGDGTIGFDRKGSDRGAINEQSAFMVPTIALSTHLPDHVDLLKLDIEGAEFPVLDHLCQTGAIQRVSRLIVEFHVTVTETRMFLSVLRRLIDSGMNVVIGSGYVSTYAASASARAPFDVINQGCALVEVYAWRDENDVHRRFPG